MGYISACTWRDLTDGHLYREGDSFPFDGREVGADRLEELTSGHNRAGLRLLKEIPTKAEEAPETPETPSEEAPAEETQEPKKRSRKKAAE